jgi:hypothetical protein
VGSWGTGERYEVIRSAIHAIGQTAVTQGEKAFIGQILASPQAYYRLVREVITQAGSRRGVYLRITAVQINRVRGEVLAVSSEKLPDRNLSGGKHTYTGVTRPPRMERENSGVNITSVQVSRQGKSGVQPSFSLGYKLAQPVWAGLDTTRKQEAKHCPKTIVFGSSAAGSGVENPAFGATGRAEDASKAGFTVKVAVPQTGGTSAVRGIPPTGNTGVSSGKSSPCGTIEVQNTVHKGEKWSKRVLGLQKVHPKSWRSWRTSVIMATRLRRCWKQSSDITQQLFPVQSASKIWGGCPSVPVEKTAAQAATTRLMDKPSQNSRVGEWKENCTVPSAPSKNCVGVDNYYYH